MEGPGIAGWLIVVGPFAAPILIVLAGLAAYGVIKLIFMHPRLRKYW